MQSLIIALALIIFINLATYRLMKAAKDE